MVLIGLISLTVLFKCLVQITKTLLDNALVASHMTFCDVAASRKTRMQFRRNSGRVNSRALNQFFLFND